MQIIAPVFAPTAHITYAVEMAAAKRMAKLARTEGHKSCNRATHQRTSVGSGRKRSQRGDEMFRLHLAGWSYKMIAKKMGTSRQAVADVVRRRKAT